MTIKCKAAVIRKNDCEKPFANSKPLSIEEISIDKCLLLSLIHIS